MSHPIDTVEDVLTNAYRRAEDIKRGISGLNYRKGLAYAACHEAQLTGDRRQIARASANFAEVEQRLQSATERRERHSSLVKELELDWLKVFEVSLPEDSNPFKLTLKWRNRLPTCLNRLAQLEGERNSRYADFAQAVAEAS